jgi:hypothetical protein
VKAFFLHQGVGVLAGNPLIPAAGRADPGFDRDALGDAAVASATIDIGAKTVEG